MTADPTRIGRYDGILILLLADVFLNVAVLIWALSSTLDAARLTVVIIFTLASLVGGGTAIINGYWMGRDGPANRL
jgi:hypothetical protein